MSHAALQGLGDFRTYTEIHVGNPERQQVVAAEKFTQIVELGASAAVAVDDFVEIVF